ncbi:MAG: DUF4197 domain-containing protein [Bacteroidota bacterium]
MKHNLFLALFGLGLLTSPYGVPSCDKLINAAISISEPADSSGLSESEIVEGLKTALKIGTDSSVVMTSRMNGFYGDQAIKILLPPEASVIYENKDHPLIRVSGMDKKIEEAVIALNRAAEDAAGKAGPIFKNAITGMSIADGLSILRGSNPAHPSPSSHFDSTAATAYLNSMTREALREEFSPVVNNSLSRKLIGNYSPNEIWTSLTVGYNTVAKRSFGAIEPIENTDLGAYVTEEALDGIFFKVGEEEKKIRKDPYAWARTAAGNILKRVFGK